MQASYAPGYEEIRTRFQLKRSAKEYMRFLHDRIPQDCGWRILDCGCGPGSITCDFAERVGSTGVVIGIDNDYLLEKSSQLSVARSVARERGIFNAYFERQDVTELEFPDASFDAVYAHALLDYFDDVALVEKAILEMARVCRPGGFVAFRVPAWPKLRYAPANSSVKKYHKRFVDRLESKYGKFNDWQNVVIPDFLRKKESKGLEFMHHGYSKNTHAGNLLRIWTYLFVNTLTKEASESDKKLMSETCDYCEWADGPGARIVETWHDVLFQKS